MESNEKMLELLGKLVGQFLADNGGYGNKYMTYTKGIITPNKLGGITEFVTPGTYHSSRSIIDGLCSELEKQIKKLLAIYKFDKVIVLDYEHVSWGNDQTYTRQYIRITDTKVVDIPMPTVQAQATPVVKFDDSDNKRKIEQEAQRKRDEEERIRRQKQADDDLLMSTSIMSSIAAIM